MENIGILDSNGKEIFKLNENTYLVGGDLVGVKQSNSSIPSYRNQRTFLEKCKRAIAGIGATAIILTTIAGCGGGGGGGGSSPSSDSDPAPKPPGITILNDALVKAYDPNSKDITCLITNPGASADKVKFQLGGVDYGTIDSIDNIVRLGIGSNVLNDGEYGIRAILLDNQGKEIVADTTDPILFLWNLYEGNFANQTVLNNTNVTTNYPTLREPTQNEVFSPFNTQTNDLYTVVPSLITDNGLFAVVYLPAENADPNITNNFDFNLYQSMQMEQTVDPNNIIEATKKDPFKELLVLYLPQSETELEGTLNGVDFDNDFEPYQVGNKVLYVQKGIHD